MKLIKFDSSYPKMRGKTHKEKLLEETLKHAKRSLVEISRTHIEFDRKLEDVYRSLIPFLYVSSTYITATARETWLKAQLQ